MRILLLHPPLANRRPNYQGLPLGLLYIASFLKGRGHIVKVIDYFTEPYTRGRLLQVIEDFRPELVGYSAMTANYPQAVSINQDIKKAVKALRTIIGGAHATAFPEETLKDGFDIVARAEGEETMAEIAEGLDMAGIKGLSFCRDGVISHNQERPLELNIDCFSLSARDLFPMDRYRNTLPSGHRATVLFTSRGCPFNCIFCCAGKSIFGKKVRFHSPAAIIKDMEEIIKIYNIRGFDIEDDNFLVQEDRAREMTDGFISRKWDIRFTIQATANFIRSITLLNKMRRAGCVEITLGFESGSPEILRKIKKGISVEESIRASRLIKKAHIQLGGNFMLGFPYDTPRTIRETIALAKRVNVDRPSFFIVTPLPGSELFDWAMEKGLLPRPVNWARFNRETPIFIQHLSVSELKSYRDKAYTEVFKSNFLKEVFNWRRLVTVLKEEKNLFIILCRLFPTTKKILGYFYGTYVKSIIKK